jgi:pimeloyl-ACP methyl ester carboxylesterase
VREGLCPVSGGALWYRDAGEGRVWALLFHPVTGAGRSWAAQQEMFASASIRTIAFSRRGYEGSTVEGASSQVSEWDDIDRLLDHLGIAKIDAIATGGGAYAAAAYALQRPGRIRRLILACSTLGIADGEIGRMSRALMIPGFLDLPSHFRELGPAYRAANPVGTEAWRSIEANSLKDVRLRFQPLGVDLNTAALAQLRQPSLLIAGGADLLATPPMLMAMASAMPETSMKVLANCGHSAFWEEPTRFNRLARDFLRA